jgi:hypothetical protein
MRAQWMSSEQGPESTRQPAAVTLLTVDVDYLANLVRCTGILVACVASCLAAPEATRHFYQGFRASAVRTGKTVAKATRAAWRHVRGHAPVDVRHVSGTLYFGDSARVTDAIHVERDYAAGTLEERVGRLEHRFADLKAAHAATQQALSLEATERRQAVKQVSIRIEDEVASMRERSPPSSGRRSWSTPAQYLWWVSASSCPGYPIWSPAHLRWAAWPSPARSWF